MPWEAHKNLCLIVTVCDGSGHRASWNKIRIAGVSMSFGCAAIGRRWLAERACVTLQLAAITVTSSSSDYNLKRSLLQAVPAITT